MARYSLFILKVQLNANQPTNLSLVCTFVVRGWCVYYDWQVEKEVSMAAKISRTSCCRCWARTHRCSTAEKWLHLWARQARVPAATTADRRVLPTPRRPPGRCPTSALEEVSRAVHPRGLRVTVTTKAAHSTAGQQTLLRLYTKRSLCWEISEARRTRCRPRRIPGRSRREAARKWKPSIWHLRSHSLLPVLDRMLVHHQQILHQGDLAGHTGPARWGHRTVDRIGDRVSAVPTTITQCSSSGCQATGSSRMACSLAVFIRTSLPSWPTALDDELKNIAWHGTFSVSPVEKTLEQNCCNRNVSKWNRNSFSSRPRCLLCLRNSNKIHWVIWVSHLFSARTLLVGWHVDCRKSRNIGQQSP